MAAECDPAWKSQKILESAKGGTYQFYESDTTGKSQATTPLPPRFLTIDAHLPAVSKMMVTTPPLEPVTALPSHLTVRDEGNVPSSEVEPMKALYGRTAPSSEIESRTVLSSCLSARPSTHHEAAPRQ